MFRPSLEDQLQPPYFLLLYFSQRNTAQNTTHSQTVSLVIFQNNEHFFACERHTHTQIRKTHTAFIYEAVMPQNTYLWVPIWIRIGYAVNR